jgi:arylsulfatase A-like enzyme
MPPKRSDDPAPIAECAETRRNSPNGNGKELNHLFNAGFPDFLVCPGIPVRQLTAPRNPHVVLSSMNRLAPLLFLSSLSILGAAPPPAGVPVVGIDFNCSDALGAPSQMFCRVVAGSADSSKNAAGYSVDAGAVHVKISRPGGGPFEFRGANADPARAIPGGDTSLSFMVADFIATRKGPIDITVAGLPAGRYLFQSFHLDTATVPAPGFAPPGKIEARVATKSATSATANAASVRPTSLGPSGLGTTFIDDSQIPTISLPFESDGASPATIRLSPAGPDNAGRALVLNGIRIFRNPGAGDVAQAPRPAPRKSAKTKHPNILFIAIDDLRPELGCFGEAHMHTPNIDRLASQGRLFRRHYVAVPTCGASRYALMSGFRPTRATTGNGAFSHMPKSRTSTPESWVDMLRRAGWHTVSLGKVSHEPDGFRWHLRSGNYDLGRDFAKSPEMRFSWNEILYGHGPWGAQRYPLFACAGGTGRVRGKTPAYEIGVDKDGASLPDDAYPDGRIARGAIGKLRELAAAGQPFCFAVGFYKPHLPFNAPKKYYDLYDPANLPAPDPAKKPVGAEPATTRQSGEPSAYTNHKDRPALRRAYFACVSYTDAQVGKVLDELDALGISENTIVVLWGDHGWCLDDYTLLGKHVVLERGVHSPLIVRLPKSLGAVHSPGTPSDSIVETIDIYPTLAELCGLVPPRNIDGRSFAPILRDPAAPGRDTAYSRFGKLVTVRARDWRLIRCPGGDDLYDLSTHPYELEDVHEAHPDVAGKLGRALNPPARRSSGSR